MGKKKFLLIPLFFFLYLLFVDAMVSSNIVVGGQSAGADVPGGVAIGVGDAVGVSVMRPYLFGLLMLPVYSASFGDISGLHTIFFYLMAGMTGVFIAMERKGRSGIASVTALKEEKTGGVKGMKLEMEKSKIARTLIVGFGGGFIAYLLSGDGGSSVALALLLFYLEIRLK